MARTPGDEDNPSKWREQADHTKAPSATSTQCPRSRPAVAPKNLAVNLTRPSASRSPLRPRHQGRAPRRTDAAGPRRVKRLIRILTSAWPGPKRARGRPALPIHTPKDRLHEARRLAPRLLQRSARPADKRALHRGNKRTLNLYINGGGHGTCRCRLVAVPWQYSSAPRLEGVSVTTASLPGARARGYNPATR